MVNVPTRAPTPMIECHIIMRLNGEEAEWLLKFMNNHKAEYESIHYYTIEKKLIHTIGKAERLAKVPPPERPDWETR